MPRKRRRRREAGAPSSARGEGRSARGEGRAARKPADGNAGRTAAPKARKPAAKPRAAAQPRAQRRLPRVDGDPDGARVCRRPSVVFLVLLLVGAPAPRSQPRPLPPPILFVTRARSTICSRGRPTRMARATRAAGPAAASRRRSIWRRRTAACSSAPKRCAASRSPTTSRTSTTRRGRSSTKRRRRSASSAWRSARRRRSPRSAPRSSASGRRGKPRRRSCARSISRGRSATPQLLRSIYENLAYAIDPGPEKDRLRAEGLWRSSVRRRAPRSAECNILHQWGDEQFLLGRYDAAFRTITDAAACFEQVGDRAASGAPM